MHCMSTLVGWKIWHSVTLMVSHTSQIHVFILYNSGIGDVGEGGEGGVSTLIMGTKI